MDSKTSTARVITTTTGGNFEWEFRPSRTRMTHIQRTRGGKTHTRPDTLHWPARTNRQPIITHPASFFLLHIVQCTMPRPPTHIGRPPFLVTPHPKTSQISILFPPNDTIKSIITGKFVRKNNFKHHSRNFFPFFSHFFPFFSHFFLIFFHFFPFCFSIFFSFFLIFFHFFPLFSRFFSTFSRFFPFFLVFFPLFSHFFSTFFHFFLIFFPYVVCFCDARKKRRKKNTFLRLLVLGWNRLGF